MKRLRGDGGGETRKSSFWRIIREKDLMLLSLGKRKKGETRLKGKGQYIAVPGRGGDRKRHSKSPAQGDGVVRQPHFIPEKGRKERGGGKSYDRLPRR